MQTFTHSTAVEQAKLVAAARAGDGAALVEYLYSGFLMCQAAGLVATFRANSGARLDAEDVAMVGVEFVLSNLDQALRKNVSPVAWLLKFAKLRMLDFCEEQSSLIRVPARMQRRGRRCPAVLSLDAPLDGCEDLALLDLIPASG